MIIWKYIRRLSNGIFVNSLKTGIWDNIWLSMPIEFLPVSIMVHQRWNVIYQSICDTLLSGLTSGDMTQSQSDPSLRLWHCWRISPWQWRHNEHDGVSNHQPHDGLFNRLFRRRSKKTSKLHVTGLREGNSPVTGGYPHKGPVTQKMCPFDDVIIRLRYITRHANK